jgi:cation transporter-like permease
MHANPVRTARLRAVWLTVNLATAVLASFVIGQFEGAIEKIVALAVLMPIVASMGGNAGTQTMTVAVRALAMGELTAANALRFVAKEAAVGGLNGMIFALIMGAAVVAWYGDWRLGAVIGAAMVCNLLAAALLSGNVQDYTSGFVAVRRSALERVPLRADYTYGDYCIDFLYRACRAGLSVREIPFRNIERQAGETKTAPDFRRFAELGFAYVRTILKLRFRGG